MTKAEIFEMGRQASVAGKPRNLLSVPEYMAEIGGQHNPKVTSFMWASWYRGYDWAVLEENKPELARL